MASGGLEGIDLCQFPAALPPNGETWNFVNPTTLAPATLSVGIILTTWAVAFAAARIYVNIRKLNLADYLIIFGSILNIAFTGIILSLIKYNRHQWNVPACWFDGSFMKRIFVQVLLVGPVLLFSKSAIFLMYRQFFWMYQPIRPAVYIGLVFTFLIYIPSIPFAAVTSAPHAGQTWEEFIFAESGQHESAGVTWGIVQGSSSVVLDLFIFVIPLPILARLHLEFSKRLQILAVFATALMGVAASIVALVYRVFLRDHQEDTTWWNSCLGIAMMVENNIAIIVASMPAFASFMRVYVLESSLYKRMRSKITKKVSDSGILSMSSLPRFGLGTFGSPRRRQPQESGESTLAKSQATSQGDGTRDKGQDGQEGDSIPPIAHTRIAEP